MHNNWADKRREFRFQLKGSFEGFKFSVGAHCVEAEPIDISRTGLGLIIDRYMEKEEEVELKIHFPDEHPPVTLHVRFRMSERDAESLQARTRCGLELSEKDKRRGIDLIKLLSGKPKLRLLCA